MCRRMRTRDIAGISVPTFIYGTAWKEERTSALVTAALSAGFRAIDTANQRKHYYEEGVGRALQEAFARGVVTREEIFLQTKFTFRDGQDHRLPYDPRAPVADQVEESFESSLDHLGVDEIDSLVLHGPSRRLGLGAMDHDAWRGMENLQRAGHVRFLGVSNVSAEQLEAFLLMRVRPTFVQNRCYASRRWDAAVRDVCDRNGLVYQGFSLLTANDKVIRESAVAKIAKQRGKTPAQIVFRFAQQVGMIPLTGTSDAAHMAQDLAIDDLELEPAEIEAILRAAA
jgi:diketogulonate reductase-like aldo/keto reductase